MEDKHFGEDDIFNSEMMPQALKMSLFGVLDGHNGQDVVKFCCNNIPNLITEAFKNYSA